MSKIINNYFGKFDFEAILTDLFSKLISLFLLLLAFYLAKKLIHLSVKKIIQPSLKLAKHEINRQRTLARLIENVLNYALYFLLVYWALTILGLPVSSLLAGAGIAGVAIGLGAQGFLTDLVNGFFILLERQFDVGDFVTLTNGSITITGTVYSVGIRTTQVRGADGTLHFIPNRNILVVSNQSRGDMRVQIDLPLAMTVDLEKVYQVIEKVNDQELENYTAVTQAPIILGPQTGSNGQFSFRINIFVENGQQIAIYHAFYRLYQEALLEAGISFMSVYPGSFQAK